MNFFSELEIFDIVQAATSGTGSTLFLSVCSFILITLLHPYLHLYFTLHPSPSSYVLHLSSFTDEYFVNLLPRTTQVRPYT